MRHFCRTLNPVRRSLDFTSARHAWFPRSTAAPEWAVTVKVMAFVAVTIVVTIRARGLPADCLRKPRQITHRASDRNDHLARPIPRIGKAELRIASDLQANLLILPAIRVVTNHARPEGQANTKRRQRRQVFSHRHRSTASRRCGSGACSPEMRRHLPAPPQSIKRRSPTGSG